MIDIFLVIGLGVIIYMVTQLIKVLINRKMGGKELRKQNFLVSKIVLPSVPVVAGGLLSAIIPLRPVMLEEYVAGHASGFGAIAVYVLYGCLVGQFSKSIYMDSKKAFGGLWKRV